MGSFTKLEILDTVKMKRKNIKLLNLYKDRPMDIRLTGFFGIGSIPRMEYN